MARLVTSGWELNEAAANEAGTAGGVYPDPFRTTTTSVCSVVTSPVRSGTYAGQIVRLSGATDGPIWTITSAANAAASTSYFSRFYFRTDTLPTTVAMWLATFGAGTAAPGLKLTTTGTLQLRDGTGLQVGSDSVATIAPNTWYRIELGFDTDGSTNSVTGTLLLDGTQVATGSLTSTAQSGSPLKLVMGNPVNLASGNAMTMNFDDLAINDSTGASQTSWPGEGRVVLLRPTADSAVGTGWTLGNATATGGSAWSRLNKAPPDSATDLTTTADADQIRNATSNASVNYDATMTSYTAAGINLLDAVNVVTPIIATGAPVVTSAKAGTVGVASNPAIANISLGAGGTSGAFWSGVAMGAYPTGNKWSFGTITHAPSVTMGTAPVMRVTQVTASTRIAIVTEMGMYVDYTPAPVIPPTPLVHQSIPFYPRASRPS